MRHWRRFVGEPGDLADIIVAILSVVSIDYGTSQVPITEFHGFLFHLQEKFPALLPGFNVIQGDKFAHSKIIGDALDNTLRLGIRTAGPMFQYFEVSKREGRRNIELLQQNNGIEFIQRLRPVAEHLAQLVREYNIPV